MIIKTTVRSRVSIDLTATDPRFVKDLTAKLTYNNPDFFKKERMGLPTYNLPRKIQSWERDMDTLYINRGASGLMRELATQHGHIIRFDDQRVTVPAEMHSEIVLYDYQVPAVQALLKAQQGVLRGGCGCGKTQVALAAIERAAQRTLVVVWNNSLMTQWSERVQELFGFAPGIIGGGKKKIGKITIGMQQTLIRDLWWKDMFGCIVEDECHRAPCNTMQEVLNASSAKYVWGVSANETRKDGLDMLVYDTFGPKLWEISNESIALAGRAMPVHIRVIPTEYDDPLYRCELRKELFRYTIAKRKAEHGAPLDLEEWEDRLGHLLPNCKGCNASCKYAGAKLFELLALRYSERPNHTAMLNHLVRDVRRNELILKVILHEYDRSVRKPMLLLTDRLVACDFWQRELNRIGIKTGLLIGGQGNRSKTEETKMGLASGEYDMAVGTTIADEGLDIPELSRIIISCPTAGHWRRLEQQIGRAKRTALGKADAIVYYLLDHMLFPGHINTFKHRFSKGLYSYEEMNPNDLKPCALGVEGEMEAGEAEEDAGEEDT